MMWFSVGDGPFGPKKIWTKEQHEEYELLKNETEEQWQRREDYKDWMDKKNKQKRERSLGASKLRIRAYRRVRGVWKNVVDKERDKKRLKVELKDYKT